MTLRKSLLALTFCLFALQMFAVGAVSSTVAASPDQMDQLKSSFAGKDLSTMTVKDMESLTGHKMKFTEKVAFKLLKMKAKKMKHRMANGHGAAEPAIEKGVYIILAILIPFVAVGLATNFVGGDWLICLLLSLLFYLPGLIYALIKMKDYYG